MSRPSSPWSVAILAVVFALASWPSNARSAEKDAPAPKKPNPDRVDVEQIKEKYWARGEESELGVVQNRLYSKARRFELGVIGGMTSTDPFVSVKTLGATFGFHFNEYFSAHAIGWKSFSSSSSALEVLEASGKRTNTNPPSSFMGGEGRASLIYGKLSLLGKSIIYYDFHLLAGAGVTRAEAGSYFTPYAGLGQQIYLSNHLSLLIDYRVMRYTERAKEKVLPSRLGQLGDPRVNWSHNLSLGISLLFGGGSK